MVRNQSICTWNRTKTNTHMVDAGEDDEGGEEERQEAVCCTMRGKGDGLVARDASREMHTYIYAERERQKHMHT